MDHHISASDQFGVDRLFDQRRRKHTKQRRNRDFVNKSAAEQVITITNTGELASLNDAISADNSSLVVLENANEGLYRVGDDGAFSQVSP